MDFVTQIWPLTLIVFVGLWVLSVRLRDASIVDFWWGPGMGAMMMLAFYNMDTEPGLHGLAALSLLVLWSVRSGFVLGRRRLNEGHEDPRYTALRNSWGQGFWWKSLFIVFTLQAVLQGVIAYGAIAVLLTDPQVLMGPLALIGIVIAVIGLAVETISDYQLDVHRTRAESRSLFTGGLRRFVRYPNYAGEIAFWIGIALIGVDVGTYWGVLSAGLMLFLLRYVSGVNLLDERLKETRSEFATYAEQVPALVPTLSSLFGNSKIPDGARAFDDR